MKKKHSHYEELDYPTLIKRIKPKKQIGLDIISSQNLAEQSLNLFLNQSISTESILHAAQKRVYKIRNKQRITFSPLFPTNHCDSDCLMCGMRNSNKTMQRKFSGRKTILEQLNILLTYEKTKGVGFVTGEYEGSFARKANAFWVGWGIRQAFDLKFNLVFCNIGSLTSDEIEILAEWFDANDPVYLSVFQETYHRVAYAKFMGKASPKSDFQKRLKTFDAWLDCGFKNVNPGILVGLAPVEVDLAHLMHHVEHLKSRDANVAISLPRLRPALGTQKRTNVKDDVYLRLLATIACVVPDCPLVLTTRESRDLQEKALPIVGIVSPGSPDVSPYRKNATPPNNIRSSQFLVADLSRPSEVLKWISSLGYSITNWSE